MLHRLAIEMICRNACVIFRKAAARGGSCAADRARKTHQETTQACIPVIVVSCATPNFSYDPIRA